MKLLYQSLHLIAIIVFMCSSEVRSQDLTGLYNKVINFSDRLFITSVITCSHFICSEAGYNGTTAWRTYCSGGESICKSYTFICKFFFYRCSGIFISITTNKLRRSIFYGYYKILGLC